MSDGKASDSLEPDEAKVSRPVLRGEGGSNAARLPDTDGLPSKRRLIAVAIISVAILLVIVLLTGNQTLSSPAGAPQITAIPPTAAATSAPSTPSGPVKGSLTVAVKHLKGHTWRFRYTLRATGTTPVGGFQLTGPTAHLFRVTGPAAWSYYGNGACNSTGPTGLLIYWSTNGATAAINPGRSATFGFEVNTSGTVSGSYALSYGTSSPQFGQIRAPAGSNLAITGPCK
jgi:hypothetical protein